MLAPLAFIVYINDLLTGMNDEQVLSIGYADDTCFLLNFSSGVDGDVIEKLLVRVKKWSDSNGLLLNAKKCCYMIFGNRSKKPMNPVKIQYR